MMAMMPKELLKKAERIARHAHAGQLDKAGAPYIGHPARVASALRGDIFAEALGWVHDVVEDTSVTLADFRAADFPSWFVVALDAITHRPNEPRVDYYARVRVNPLALRVKLADIADNIDPTRMAALDPKVRERLVSKYKDALSVLAVRDQGGE